MTRLGRKTRCEAHREGEFVCQVLTRRGYGVELYRARVGDLLVAVATTSGWYSEGTALRVVSWYKDCGGQMLLRMEGRKGSFLAENFRPLDQVPAGLKVWHNSMDSARL